MKNKMSLLEFAKTFDLQFKPSAFMEKYLELLNSDGKISLTQSFKPWYKEHVNNELTTKTLATMKLGNTFALCSPDGCRVFKLIKIGKMNRGASYKKVIYDELKDFNNGK